MVRSRNASRSKKRVRSFNKSKNQKSKSSRKRTFKRKKGGSQKQEIKTLKVLEDELIKWVKTEWVKTDWSPDEFMKSLFNNFDRFTPIQMVPDLTKPEYEDISNISKDWRMYSSDPYKKLLVLNKYTKEGKQVYQMVFYGSYKKNTRKKTGEYLDSSDPESREQLFKLFILLLSHNTSRPPILTNDFYQAYIYLLERKPSPFEKKDLVSYFAKSCNSLFGRSGCDNPGLTLLKKKPSS